MLSINVLCIACIGTLIGYLVTLLFGIRENYCEAFFIEIGVIRVTEKEYGDKSNDI